MAPPKKRTLATEVEKLQKQIGIVAEMDPNRVLEAYQKVMGGRPDLQHKKTNTERAQNDGAPPTKSANPLMIAKNTTTRTGALPSTASAVGNGPDEIATDLDDGKVDAVPKEKEDSYSALMRAMGAAFAKTYATQDRTYRRVEVDGGGLDSEIAAFVKTYATQDRTYRRVEVDGGGSDSEI